MSGKTSKTGGKTVLNVDVQVTKTPAAICGVDDDNYSLKIIQQACRSAWIGNCQTAEQVDSHYQAVIQAMVEIAPKDAMEGMLAAQMVATHNAVMECYRRAMLPEQTFEGRQMTFTQANKLTRSYAVLMETLDRHRGKGQQKIIVQHMNVEPGGKAAFVGTVNQAAGSDIPPAALGYDPGMKMADLDGLALVSEQHSPPVMQPVTTLKNACDTGGGDDNGSLA